MIDVQEVNQQVCHVCSYCVVPRELLPYQVAEKPPQGMIGTDAQTSSSWTSPRRRYHIAHMSLRSACDCRFYWCCWDGTEGAEADGHSDQSSAWIGTEDCSCDPR